MENVNRISATEKPEFRAKFDKMRSLGWLAVAAAHKLDFSGFVYVMRCSNAVALLYNDGRVERQATHSASIPAPVGYGPYVKKTATGMATTKRP